MERPTGERSRPRKENRNMQRPSIINFLNSIGFDKPARLLGLNKGPDSTAINLDGYKERKKKKRADPLKKKSARRRLRPGREIRKREVIDDQFNSGNINKYCDRIMSCISVYYALALIGN